MPENVLYILHNATTLLFGVYISAAFLGIRMDRRNVLTLLWFSAAVGALCIISNLLWGGGRHPEDLPPDHPPAAGHFFAPVL